MESRRGNGKVQYQGKGRLLKRCFTFMLAVMVTFTSIPLNMAWADELPYSERPGDDEIILDDSVEDGDLSDIDLDISHTISKKGDKAVVTVSAAPSESGQENGVTKVTKVEIHQNGKLKKGKRSDDKWEFTVKENGVYSFVIYYNSKDGEDTMVASPSEVEKVEPTKEAEPQNPGANTGGAGGAGGGGAALPEENPDQEVTEPETEEGTTGNITEDDSTEDKKENDGIVEGDSNQNTSNEPDQKPSDNTESDGKEEGKGDITDNQGGTDSSEQGGSSTSGSDTDTSTDKENSDSSSSSDNNSDTNSNDNNSSSSSDSGSSDSTDNSASGSSSSNDSGSSDSSSSNSSGSSSSGSSDSGSSDNSGSDEGSDSSGTSIALNVIDFIFPVIEAQASDFTVKKAVIVEYEITNLFPEGNPEDVDVDIFDELTEEGAMITLLAEPSEIGLEKGVREITDISLIDFEPEDDSEIIDSGEISIATDSEAEEEITLEEEEIEVASPSEATYDTAKSSSVKHAEYQAPENEEGEYRFFVKENGTYTFSIRYGRATDLEFEDSAELVETQFSTTYELDSIERGVQFTGVEDTTIQAGEAFDLMAGVTAMSDIGMELPVVIQDKGGFDPAVPGTYKVTYTTATRSVLTDGTTERTITVNPIAEGDLKIVSDIHGTEDGKTLEVPIAQSITGTLSVTYDLPEGVKDRVIKIALPESATGTYPTDHIVERYSQYIGGVLYTCLKIDDATTGNLAFDVRYQINYTLTEYNVEAYLLANGHLDIERIHIIASGNVDSTEKQLAEASIGPFTTERLEEGPKPIITYKMGGKGAARNAPYSYDVERNSSGGFLYPYTVASQNGNLSGGYTAYFDLGLPLNYNWGYKPLALRAVRIYAPVQFSFELSEYDQARGVSIGTEDDGNVYLEISCSNREGYGKDSVFSTLSRTKLILLNENAEVDIGEHFSKATKFVFLDYNGKNQTIEVEPILKVNYIGNIFNEGDCLELYSNYPREDLYPLEPKSIYEYRLSNGPTYVKTEGGFKYYKVPNIKENVTFSITYPQEVQPKQWSFSESIFTSSAIKIEGEYRIDKVIMHLASGETVEAAQQGSDTIYLNDDSINPAGSHVDSIDIVFDKFYGYTTSIQTTLVAEKVNKEKNVITQGKVQTNNVRGNRALRIKPRDIMEMYGDLSVVSYYLNNEEVLGSYSIGSYTANGIATNPKVVINEQPSLRFFTGTASFNELLLNGKLTYETSSGRTGEFDIQEKDKEVEFVNLASGETLTKIVLSKDGAIILGSSRTMAKFNTSTSRAALLECYKISESDIGTMEVDAEFICEERDSSQVFTDSRKLYFLGDVTLKNPRSLSKISPTVYQGDDFVIKSPTIYIDNVNSLSNVSIPLELSIYIKLENTDKFVFTGTDKTSYSTEIIEALGDKYVKLIPKVAKNYKMENGLDKFIQYNLPDLSFKVLPGADLGKYLAISDIYIDCNTMIQSGEKYKKEYYTNMQYQALIRDDLGLSGADEGEEPHMWKVNTSDQSIGAEILQQSLATVTVTPGLEEIYSNTDQEFYPTGRFYLNAMAGIGSGSNDLANYIIKIPIPRKGENVKYSYNGIVNQIESEYDVFLRNEPRFTNHGIDYKATYRLEGDVDFISASSVGSRWAQVVEIKTEIDMLPAKSAILVYLDLEAEDKGNVGLDDKYAYIAAEYEYNHGDTLYGPKANYIYKDFQITGKAWIDNSENGKYESGEAYANNIDLTLLQNGTEAATDSYSLSVNRSNGTYIVTTYLYEDLALRFDGLDKSKAGIKPTLVKDSTNGSTSVFEREGEWTAALPTYFDEHQSGYDLGIVKLPIITANNTQVGYKSEAQADVTVVNQTNAPAVNSQIIYSAAADPSVAGISEAGLIKGLKENSLTTATVSVKNSLGDEVTADYQIAVSDNKIPILTVHPWVAIEGDRISDLWAGITAEDPEEEYPAWKALLFGANNQSRSIPADKKIVTIYTNSGYTDEISLDDALNAHGLYYMRYSVEDDKENVVTADTTLTVYGKMQGKKQSEKHYFSTGANVSVKNAEFYYLDTIGTRVPVTVADAGSWALTEGVLTEKTLVASHPKANEVTEGITAGNGRSFSTEVKGAVDSKVNAIPVADYIALVGEANVRIGWLSDTDGVYNHYEISGLGTPKEVFKSVEDENGNVLSDTRTGTGIIDVDTSTPGVYQHVKTAEVLEDYDNVDDVGAPLKNMASRNIKVTVIGKPEVKATEVIYITPDKSADQTFIKDKIAATATYHDGTTDKAAIPEGQITYQFNETDGKITSVDITAWGGRADNLSEPSHVNVIIREVPVLTLPDIHLRKGTTYGDENFMNRVMTPEDEHNEYVYHQNNLNTDYLGKYEAQYKVSDNLTGASGSPAQTIFVHGIPEIIATDKSLYAHQSTGEQALIDTVKMSARATVEYTKADGTTEIKTIPADELQYEVAPDYVAGTVGRFKVTITVNDAAYAPAGLEPMQVTKDVYVDVADQLFDVTFTTNSDNFHDRGTVDGEAGPVVKPTIYGKTAAASIPAANDGYHFDGFKTLSQVKATQPLTLNDGTVIAAGDEIPVGSILSIEQVQSIEIYGNVGFQAYFSATPVLNGRDIKLYVGETYKQADLGITVTDLDGDAQGAVINDSHVDTGKAGTYQIKVSVDDGDQNHAEMYVYVQVYGKTELEGYDPIHIRKGQDLNEEQLKDTVKAVYLAPPAVPDSPWSEASQPAVQTEVPFTMEGAVNTGEIGLTKLTISAEGQIDGRETDGRDSGVRDVFVHGKPIITANDGALFTHQSTGETVLIDLIKQNAAASIQYVESDGSIRTETIPAEKLNYEVKPEEHYQPGTEGTYKVTVSLNDTEYVPQGLLPMDVELPAAVIVSDKAYSVKFTINNDADYHKGDYEGGITEFNTNAIHGNPVGRVPVPVEADGYHFDGFKVLTTFTTTDDIVLADGSIISAGTQIPVGTILTSEQVKVIKIYEDVEFEAYFSASPTIKGENVVLYEKEAYSQDKLHIEVSDLDRNAQAPVIDDSHVDTDVAGTYQIKVTVLDTDGNQAEKYLYVQVVGKTRFVEILDLHTRKDTTLTKEQLLANVKAVYDKPEDIPEEPWTEANKVNNGRAAITTAVEVRSFDEVNTGTIEKTKIDLSASGMIHGREMTGKADAERDIYIHGMPVIVAYDNGIYTHQSKSDTVLEQSIRTGIGSLERDAASAYVEYVQPDGSIKKVVIDPGKITYAVNQYVPLTAGDYTVDVKVDDFSVIEQAQAPDLLYMTGEKTVTVVVADKMYSVMFETGEHGGLEDPTESITAVAHGKTVTSPKLAPKEGYILDYWVDEAGNRISDISSVVITENRKFTAEFKLKEFVVRFIGKNERVISTEIVKYGHDATPPTNDKDVKNKRFDGWSTSYTNITKDTDIYATYWKNSGGGGGPSGGGSYVPTGPGMISTITEPDVPKNPFENLVTIGTNPVPKGNVDIPVFTGLPKTGDVSVGSKAGIGYQATLIDGTVALSEEEPLVGHQNGGFIHAFEDHADWRKCILHIILLIISALEGIFYLFKRRKDKRLLEKLRKELEEEEN